MKVETEIKKWGNSLALRVSGIMAEIPGFAAGTRVTVEVSEDGLVIKPTPTEVAEPSLPYSEKELLADITPEKAHADAIANPNSRELGDN